MDFKWTAMILLGALGAGKANATEKIRLEVYVQGDNSAQPWALPEGLASEILGRIGVRVNWHTGKLPEVACAERHCIGIRLVEHAPVSRSPQALASAQPFGASGSLISVYQDRVQRLLSGRPTLSDVLLAYIFAHELAHVMIGSDYHSDAGVLKAHWSHSDFSEMRARRLGFPDVDSDRIHDGMAVRPAVR